MCKKIYQRLHTYVIVFGLAAVAAGCSIGTDAEKENEETIEAVLEQLFTGPDQELIELVNDPENQTVIGEGVENTNENTNEEENELDVYLEEMNGPYFTEDALELFTAVYLLYYQVEAENNDIKMKPDDIDIEQIDEENGRYNFTMDVTYEEEADEKKSEIGKVKGYVNFTDDDKITRFEITEDEWIEGKLDSFQ